MSVRPQITRMDQLPKIPVTIGDMSFNRTGLWRYLMPRIEDRTAPCQGACPLGMPSPDFINLLLTKGEKAALALIMELNPLPGLTGRLCYHPCQSKCLRKELEGGVGIQGLERYLADKAPLPGPVTDGGARGMVAVLGAGPLGLSAAYFLGRAGCSVTVFDPLERPGGFLTGLDPDRLPPAVLEKEIHRMAALGGMELKLAAEWDQSLAGFGEQGWDLVIHDHLSHAQGSGPAESLERMLAKVGGSARLIKPPEEAKPYKTARIAHALADGRGLALEGLRLLGQEHQAAELGRILEVLQLDSPLGPNDIRYRFFESMPPAPADAARETFSRPEALNEARRCLSCGHCVVCGRCLAFCPDVSLSLDETKNKPQVDEMHCKGCGICAHECPRGAIVMER